MSRHVDMTPAAGAATGQATPVLAVRGLTTVLHLDQGPVEVVRGVEFDVLPRETVALVGESGCGKSMTMLSVMGLHPQPPAEIVSGEILLDGVDLLAMPEERRRAVRGAELAMVYQDPMTSLNPLMRIGDQIAEVLLAHGRPRRAARERTIEVLSQVGIPQPRRAAAAYPHEFSGGMRQRVVIAMALALHPKVLIADEPTTALDVTIQQQIIALVASLRQQLGMAVVWVTHDLGVVARVAERTMVMYGGHLVESGATGDVFARPEHPYTAGLLKAVPPVQGDERPPLHQIPGAPPDPARQPPGCPFHPRCRHALQRCTEQMPSPTARTSHSGGPAGPTGPTGPLAPAAHHAACWVPPEKWTS